MQEYKLVINIKDEQRFEECVPEGTTWLSLAQKYQQYYKDTIVLVRVRHKLRELNKNVKYEGEVNFVTVTDKDGKRAYRRSVTLLMQKAAYNLWGKQGKIRVHHSLGQGVFCDLEEMEVNKANLLSLKEEMLRLVERDIPIHKENVSRDYAIEMFSDCGLYDKVGMLQYRRSSRVNL